MTISMTLIIVTNSDNSGSSDYFHSPNNFDKPEIIGDFEHSILPVTPLIACAYWLFSRPNVFICYTGYTPAHSTNPYNLFIAQLKFEWSNDLNPTIRVERCQQRLLSYSKSKSCFFVNNSSLLCRWWQWKNSSHTIHSSVIDNEHPSFLFPSLWGFHFFLVSSKAKKAVWGFIRECPVISPLFPIFYSRATSPPNNHCCRHTLPSSSSSPPPSTTVTAVSSSL